MATTFQYAVRDRTGKLVQGKLDGDSQNAVVSKLVSMGYAPLSVEEANLGLKREINIPGFGKKVSLKDLAIFSRQFATMISSGLSLLRALSILVEQTENKYFIQILAQVRNEVEAGSSLSQAMSGHVNVCPPLMVNMTKAGEVGGFLDQVLEEIAKNYESEAKLRSKIKAAMTYPTVVFCISIIGVMVMLIFVVPTFGSIFKSLGGKLPTPTLILVWVSHVMKFLAPLIVVALVVVWQVYRRIKHQERVRRVLDPIKLKIPVFGNLFQKVALARFCRNLGTMMHAGVPILQSLQIVGEASGNVILQDASTAVMESVRQGESLAGPLTKHAIFPPMVVQMMSVGEDTGALDSMLHKIAEFYDQEVEALTEALTSLIEPLLIAFLGGMVGSMVIALYLPMFKVYQLVGS
jgi:type IV pilus assembly protein PilC